MNAMKLNYSNAEPLPNKCNGVDIRNALPLDCQSMAEIYNEAILSGCSCMESDPVEASYFLNILQSQSDFERLCVAISDKKIVGWGIIKRYSQRKGYAYACETAVYVASDQHARGIGSSLLANVITHAGLLGYRHLVAKILAVNEASIRFHKKLGFAAVGRQNNIGFLNGIPHDIVIMQHTKLNVPNLTVEG